MRHPVQPLACDEHGTLRFQKNEIVCFLLKHSSVTGVGLNELAEMGFSNEDFEQFAQLIGYSLSGWGDLSYVSDKTYARAERKAAKLKKRSHR